MADFPMPADVYPAPDMPRRVDWPEIFTTHCCGVQELHGISHVNPDKVLLKVAKEGWAAIFLFTGTAYGGYAEALKKAIETRGLGEVKATDGYLNPNSGNVIQAYLWAPHQKRLKAWVAEYEAMKNGLPS